jgi:hypothetical protein
MDLSQKVADAGSGQYVSPSPPPAVSVGVAPKANTPTLGLIDPAVSPVCTQSGTSISSPPPEQPKLRGPGLLFDERHYVMDWRDRPGMTR